MWVGRSREAVRAFPAPVRELIGLNLMRVQWGMVPADWKPLATVGHGTAELRVRRGGAFRVVYVASFPEAIYVLHAFEKTSRKTARLDLELARLRYRTVLASRRGR